MSRSKKGKKRGFFGKLLIFLCVAAAFGLLWFGAEFVAGLVGNRLSGTQGETGQGSGLMNTVYENLPKNSYDLSLFTRKDGFVHYTGAQTAHTGVDVSSHQGTIDWAAAAADGVEYAMIRVGYRGYTNGTITMDELFRQNVESARANGIEVGAYFFSQAITTDEAAEEAKAAVTALKGLDITYPVIFDWEHVEGGARTDGLDTTTLTDCAKTFCQAVEAAGYTAGVYFNQAFGYQELQLPELQDDVFWLAQYASAPDFYYDFQMWQYTNSGKVNGIEGDVDLNLSFWQKK